MRRFWRHVCCKMAFTGGGSLVSNILQKSSSLDERILEENVQRLTKKSNQLKGQIYELVRQKYVEYQSYVDSTVSLEQKLQEVTQEYRRLSTKIEQDLKGRITKSSDKRLEIEAKLRETLGQIDFLQRLVSVYHTLEASKSSLQSDQFCTAASQLSKAAGELEDISKSGCDAKVFLALESETAVATHNLCDRLLEEWGRFITWSPKVLPENPKLVTFLKVQLRLPSRSGSDIGTFDEVVSAMRMLSKSGIWSRKIEAFGKKLLRMVVTPLIVHPELKVLLVQDKKKAAVLTLDRAEAVSSTVSPSSSIAVLFAGLSLVFGTLSQAVPETSRQEWMVGIGGVVCPEMSDLIVKHRLSTSIPKSPSELLAYNEVSSETAKFESVLAQVGVVESDFHQLSEYTQNVNTHFAAQKCQDLLVQARSIAMKPIHDTVAVEGNEALEKLGRLDISAPVGEPAQKHDSSSGLKPGKEDLSSLTFAFPRCIISKSTREYVDLLYNTLCECCTSPSSSAVQLFFSARNMVELFCAVLSSHHRSDIAGLPRAAAVQHNNCMFLAHHLLTLGHQFHCRLPPPLNSQSTTFVDQAIVVRQLGEECFLSEMKKQSNVIHECLSSFGGFDDISGDHKCESVRKGIQQALLHTKKLSKVYAEVLPPEIHHQAVGALLDALVTNIITGVLALEDIAVDDATELCAVIDLVAEAGELTLFLDAETEKSNTELLPRYCANWDKLKQLGVVLRVSLQEIVDLWGVGKRPLAQQFTPVELRGLVKALFQNTERRATALAKISL